jgi:hypothetical protein
VKSLHEPRLHFFEQFSPAANLGDERLCAPTPLLRGISEVSARVVQRVRVVARDLPAFRHSFIVY